MHITTKAVGRSENPEGQVLTCQASSHIGITLTFPLHYITEFFSLDYFNTSFSPGFLDLPTVLLQRENYHMNGCTPLRDNKSQDEPTVSCNMICHTKECTQFYFFAKYLLAITFLVKCIFLLSSISYQLTPLPKKKEFIRHLLLLTGFFLVCQQINDIRIIEEFLQQQKYILIEHVLF